MRKIVDRRKIGCQKNDSLFNSAIKELKIRDYEEYNVYISGPRIAISRDWL